MGFPGHEFGEFIKTLSSFVFVSFNLELGVEAGGGYLLLNPSSQPGYE